ncbi:MAG: hypothetical protein ACFB21_01310 [Opitutales bacterium]
MTKSCNLRKMFHPPRRLILLTAHSKPAFFAMRTLMTTLSLSLAASTLAFAETPAPFVWIEAEQPEAAPEFASTGNWDKPDMVSGQLLQIHFDRNNIDQMPAQTELGYTFNAPEAGSYDFWGRFRFFHPHRFRGAGQRRPVADQQ